MRGLRLGCLIAACLSAIACGGGTNSETAGNSAGQDTGGGGNGGQSGGFKPGDAVDLDGDGVKDDGVAVDDNDDGKVDGVDTDGDGKSDAPLPGGNGTDASAGSNGASAGDAGGGTSAGNGSDAGSSGTGGPTCDGVGVCDDNFKDSCDGKPDTCPATQAAGIDEPAWDCQGEPPVNVYAYAKFPNGTNVMGANLAAGACVVFFEGAKGLYYAKWFKFAPKVTAKCATYDGCICPKGTILNESFDRRLYAFTWDGKDSCATISITDHAGGTPETALNQPVSNSCRKYLYALHTQGDTGISDGQDSYALPFSYVAGSLAALKQRLTAFPKVEVACIDVKTGGGALPWAQLMVSGVQTHAGFVAKK